MAFSYERVGEICRAAAERPSEDARLDFHSLLLGGGPAFATRAAAVLAASLAFAETEHAASMSADGADVAKDPSVRRDHDALLAAARRLRYGD